MAVTANSQRYATRIVRGWFRSMFSAHAAFQEKPAIRGFGHHGTIRQMDQDGHCIQPLPEGQASRTEDKDSTVIKVR
jgi:hypothetical protein